MKNNASSTVSIEVRIDYTINGVTNYVFGNYVTQGELAVDFQIDDFETVNIQFKNTDKNGESDVLVDIVDIILSEKDVPYEPYTGGKPEIVNAEKKGSINVLVNTQTLNLSTPIGLSSVKEIRDEINMTERIQRIGQIASYNNEPITTDYVSSTGTLTLGAQVNYVLPNPVRTPLTQTEVEAFKLLRSNYPTTLITNDENAPMEVSYVADTKSYVEIGKNNQTSEQISASVDKWLEAHPEATTTIQNKSIAEAKIQSDFLKRLKKNI